MADDNEKQCKRTGNLKDTVSADEALDEIRCRMGDYIPSTLAHIRKHNPELAVVIKELDRVLMEDGALDRKTKRLIAMACVAVRMCEDCVYAQAKTAVNYGATKEEIVEAMHVAVVTGGVPAWSVAKKGLTQVFNELEGTNEVVPENTPGGTADTRKGCCGGQRE
ncbi:MAG: carboxymuconolactone decarboxylase family protein [Methanomassiliicoccaceae archaeon]|nr:carboxymuconolactone decarboxylase family protein [Euryarchaeota archaeon]HOB38444.1 carboxymuconolactone decarboxylase family protein [Methanomassiliicoccaceae archaeon]HOQ26688.1 carboxymuconolactone decarboxylase family protein [Methanomassiliicoccaceae archaeon]HQA20541.1 carboxymuconolactone decarboxylase family protein [Methanomassiliicoccaceae archaeon]HQD88249.1 carboxymuconolactone decarboxylase family protein [Methanomassiliicoccaceae archaeon]